MKAEIRKNRRRGQGLIEYLVLVCLVAAASIAVVSLVGKNITEQYANVSSALQGGSRVEVTSAKSSQYKQRGMDDFMDGAKKPGGFFGGFGW